VAFQGFLKQSTAVDVLVGPFVDDGDGKTAETGLTIAQADVRLSKNGQNMAQKSDNTSCVHDELGMYNCELDATDTNTVGQLTISIHESGALPVRLDYHVVEEAVYDAMYGGSAAGPNTTTPPTAAAIVNEWESQSQADPTGFHVNVKEIGGTAQTANDNGADINAILADTNELQGDWVNGGRLDLLLDATLADTAELQGDWVNGGRLDLLLDSILADTNELQSDDIPASLSTITSHTSTLYTDWNNGGRLDLLIDSIISKVDVVDGIVDSILVDTAVIGAAGAGLTDLGGMSSGMKAEINTEVDTAFTTQMADSVPSDGAIATREQAIYMIVQMLSEMAISGTTMTVKKVDGSTTLMTLTLSDATNPTSITRAT
jgi:hypothetical protein